MKQFNFYHSKKLLISIITASMLMDDTLSFAASDEIQVYTDELNEPHEFGLELHTNYVPSGSKASPSPGEIASSHRLQLTPELSYGINETLEAGLYIPMALSNDGTYYSTGLRSRIKYIHHSEVPTPFFWGINFEYGYTSPKVTDSSWGLEIRPIGGYRTEKWLFAINPIMDIPISKGGLHETHFEPAFKISRKMNENLSIGIEHYSDMGPISHLDGWRDQQHTVFLAADYALKNIDLNVGVGHGYHNGEDNWIIKSIIGFVF
jgi:hypothetical protein